MKQNLELEIVPMKDKAKALKGYYSRVKGGMSDVKAVASGLIQAVKGPGDFVDTHATRLALLADHKCLAAIKAIFLPKKPAAKNEPPAKKD